MSEETPKIPDTADELLNLISEAKSTKHQEVLRKIDKTVNATLTSDLYHGHIGSGDLGLVEGLENKNNTIWTAFDGRQIDVRVFRKSKHNKKKNRYAESRSYEPDVSSPIDYDDREGALSTLYTYDKYGNEKTLESENPFVHKLLVEMALKEIESEAHSQKK